MLGCTEGAGMSPDVPQWPFLAYFKWYNLYFAGSQSSVAHEPLLDKFGTSFPKCYLDMCVCMCVCVHFEFLCSEFQFDFHNSENILLTMNHVECFWGILTQAAASTILHESQSTWLCCSNSSWLPACAVTVTTNAFWQHQNQWKTAQYL